MTASETSNPTGDIALRDLLSSLTALQALSMVMTDSRDEEEILDLAVAAVPSLSGHCRAEAVWLDGRWRSVKGLRGAVGPRAALEPQLACLGDASGLLESPDLGWAWASPLASRGGGSGYLVVGSAGPPPEHERSLIQLLAQQTGVALVNARLLARERAMGARIAGEQATIRRVATLVAGAAPPEEVFTAVAAEAGRLIDADSAVMSRYDQDGTATVLGGWAPSGAVHALPAGTRLENVGKSVHTLVFRTGRPARMSDYSNQLGVTADIARRWGVNSTVGAPIHLEGRLWGMIAAASMRQEPLRPDTEEWLGGFIELVATAIANAQARVELRGYADEQAALRRVATLVGAAAPLAEVFSAVAAEAARRVNADFAVMSRYDPDGTPTVVGAYERPGLANPFPVGARMDYAGQNVHTLVFDTGAPARIDDYADNAGASADIAIQVGVHSVVGVPVRLDGRLWGTIAVASRQRDPLPANTETWLASFTDLVATAIANVQARVELRGYAEEQAALRRVAILVARAAPPEEVFSAVSAEVGRLLAADLTDMARYDPDGTVTPVAGWTATGDPVPFPVGVPVSLGGRNVSTRVLQTGRPARIDDYGNATGAIADVARSVGSRAAVGVPIMVDGRLWGVMIALCARPYPLPADTEARMAGFTELAATAISEAQARMDLHTFAEEQAALRRVATLVAEGASPEGLFGAVAAEAGQLLQADFAVLSRYEPDGAAVVMGGWARTDPGRSLLAGARLEPGGRNTHALVLRTRRPARIDNYDCASGQAAEVARDRGFRSAVGAPINVEGRLWGVISVASAVQEPLPAGIEARLAGFAGLVGTALVNAETQAALTASRARIVAAADTTRRRIERDLHDGAQQQLVSLAMQIRAAQAALPPAAGDLATLLDGFADRLTGVLDELRELSSGLHPAALAQGGLRPALKTLARRAPILVNLDVRVDGRLPEPIELAAYYVVAEALTNAAKHADATAINVEVAAVSGTLRVRVRDDGRGGADIQRGSGLVGLADRVGTLGGRLFLHSPPGAGTDLQIELPLDESGRTGDKRP